MSILTTYSPWFFALCILVGLIYAGALYFRDTFNRSYGKTLATILGIVRFTAVTLLAFFLLKPLIKSINKTVEKPIIVIAQDNSQSLLFCKDSSFYKTEYLQKLKEITNAFGDDYEIRTFHFGENVKEGIDSVQFSEKLTDMSLLMDEVYTKFSGRNIGAVVIASDGLYNKGSNPLYGAKQLNVPVYTIALGDTTVHRDLLIEEVSVNQLAYLGNKFPVRISVEGRRANGESAILKVTKKGTTLFSENITFSGERFFKTIDLSLDAAELGLQKYSVTLSTISNEVTTINNRKDFFIDVLDSRQKVLCLANSPHPDLAAFQSAIESNEGYAAETALINDFKGKIGDYNLIIFHQLPALGGAGKDVIQSALAKNIPALFIWGSQTDFRTFNDLKTGYALNDYRNNNTDAGGAVVQNFALFSISDEVKNMMRNMPPLAVPFGDYQWNPGVTPFIQQQVGQINTSKPLISFHKVVDTKIGLIAGEGIWRWKLNAFRMYEKPDAFNELVVKTVQYLASKEDKSFFRVKGARNFLENESVIFEGELYNESYEALTGKEISITFKNSSDQEFKYTFSPEGARYKLNAGQLPVDNYSYVAIANNGQQNLKETGEFSVSPLQLEAVQTIADHRLLYQLAQDHGGEMISPNELNKLPEFIQAKKEIVSVAYENKSLDDLINFKWLLVLLIGLLSLEWLLRKRAGTY
ncbi:MAG: hypothetical protein ACOVOO_00935 [Flavobacteriales bacterium]